MQLTLLADLRPRNFKLMILLVVVLLTCAQYRRLGNANSVFYGKRELSGVALHRNLVVCRFHTTTLRKSVTILDCGFVCCARRLDSRDTIECADLGFSPSLLGNLIAWLQRLLFELNIFEVHFLEGTLGYGGSQRYRLLRVSQHFRLVL